MCYDAHRAASEITEYLSAFGPDSKLHEASTLLADSSDDVCAHLRSSALPSRQALCAPQARSSHGYSADRSEGARWTCASICAHRNLPSGRFQCNPPELVLRRAQLLAGLTFSNLVLDVQSAPTYRRPCDICRRSCYLRACRMVDVSISWFRLHLTAPSVRKRALIVSLVSTITDTEPLIPE